MVSTAQTRSRIGTIDWSLATRTEFWIEAMWLSALALVPILFSYNNSLVTFEEPKAYAIHFFALLMLVLLVTDTANNLYLARKRGEDLGSFDVLAWVKADRSNMLQGAIIVFVFVYVISTALSQSPFFSFWGVTPGINGYSLYTFLSMMIILFAVVTRIRTISQVRKILYVLATVGVIVSIYGISQHFGWDPLATVDTRDRVISSFGNPIYFGAYLVMSIPVTMAIALDPRFANKKIPLLVVAVALGLQLAAMWFTGSRGPLVGLAAAGTVTLFATVVLANRRQLMYPALAAGTGFAVAVVLILIPGGGGDARAVQFSGELSALTTETGGGFIQGGLGGRSEIWGDVLELSTTWETVQEGEPIARVLRPLFGFGPDMLQYSSSLVSRPRSSLEIVDHAHNRVLQVLAEQGWIGFISYVTVIGLTTWILLLIAKRLFQSRSRSNSFTAVIFIALAGALAGVAGEQLSGVGRLSDLLASWVLIGLLIVLFKHVAGIKSLDTGESVVTEGDQKKTARSRIQVEYGQPLNAIPFFIGLVLLVGALLTFVLVDVQILRASRATFGQTEAVDSAEVVTRFLDARDNAPQVEHFTTLTARILVDEARLQNSQGQIREAAILAEQAFGMLLEYHERNPLAIRTRIFLAETAALLFELGAEEFRNEMVLRYEELVTQFPNEARVLSVTANAYAAAERYEESLAMADRSLALEPLTEPLPSAWWIRGVALDRLERDSEAIVAFETSLERSSDGQFAILSHKDLAKIYDEMGEDELSKFHLDQAAALEARV